VSPLAWLIVAIVFFLGFTLMVYNIDSMFDYCEEHPNATCCPGSNTLCSGADLRGHCIKECQWAVDTGKLTKCYCNGGLGR
jgi:hypothetical protein